MRKTIETIETLKFEKMVGIYNIRKIKILENTFDTEVKHAKLIHHR